MRNFNFLLAVGLVSSVALGFSGNADAKKKKDCNGGSLISTECGAKTNNKYKGTGGKKPTLNPRVCLPDWAYDLMTGPGIDFWYDFELNYPGGVQEKGDSIVKAQCSKKQWVSPGTWLTFWVDCEGYRWFFKTGRIASSGTYTYDLVRKVKL